MERTAVNCQTPSPVSCTQMAGPGRSWLSPWRGGLGEGSAAAPETAADAPAA